MSAGDDARMWRARLRWRLRGALLWPLFVVLTIGDALLLHVEPIAGRHTGLVGGLLLAMLANIVVVAVVGRLAALRRRRAVPAIVAEDRAGSAALVAVTVVFAVLGIVHAPGRHAADRAFAAQRAAVRAYVLAHGAAIYRAHLGAMDTREQADDFFRTCVPGDAQAGLPPLCLLVRTDHSPPRVVVDSDRTPN